MTRELSSLDKPNKNEMPIDSPFLIGLARRREMVSCFSTAGQHQLPAIVRLVSYLRQLRVECVSSPDREAAARRNQQLNGS